MPRDLDLGEPKKELRRSYSGITVVHDEDLARREYLLLFRIPKETLEDFSGVEIREAVYRAVNQMFERARR